ncbi:MAG: prepilin-type N-terminal cleavage/methylation domain-containing protein [Phycisphaerae bacterium]
MKQKPGFTLIEIMVVVAIIALLAVLSLPTIRSMQSSNAHAQSFNIINAALQGARSYAIMHGINTAARFQPNGKIFLVYKVPIGSVRVAYWGNEAANNPYPNPSDPNIYLPVVDQEPLELPRGYAVKSPAGLTSFEEPFYICYKSDGTIAVNESIWVGLTTSDGQPVNPDFDGDGNPAWDNSTSGFGGGLGSYYTNYNAWKIFTNDTNKITDTDDIKIARFYNVTNDNTTNEGMEIVNDADHFGGYTNNASTAVIPRSSVNQIQIFPTPDGWNELPIITNDGTKSKSSIIIPNNQIDTIFINPYTGRVIRTVE